MVDSQPEAQSGRKLFYGLFIFPLVIAVGMAVLLCTVVLLTSESETPESLITSIKTGSPSKRWQKAFELSNELNQGRGMIREAGVMKEVIHILGDRKEYDAKTRSYMAIALSRFDEQVATDALMKALAEETEIDVQLYLIWALGVKRVNAASSQVKPFLLSESSEIRKMAAYVMGVIGSSEDTKALEALLGDGAQDVRWNSAVALARLGSDAGFQEILQMLDRKSLMSSGELSEGKVEEIMINALKGLSLIKNPEVLSILTDLSENDSSLKVRKVALELLKHY